MDLPVGEAAEDQIHLAYAAMPGAEQELAPARIQAFARSHRSRHVADPALQARI
jgi:hypothetical protein